MGDLPKISSAFLNLTNACNLGCRYCFVQQHPDYMSLQTATDAADFLAKNATGGTSPSINFFGGEPLLMWDSIIVPLTDYIRDKYGKRYRLSMTSNCILMDEAKLEYMKQNEIGLLFSLDGDKATNDYNRPCHDGKSSFDILEKKIPLILSYYPDMVFRATIIPETCQHTFHNLMFAVESGYHNVFVTPNTLTNWDNEAKTALAACMREYSEYVIQCYRGGTKPPSFSALNKAFRNIPAINYAIQSGRFRDRAGCLAEGKCGLGASKFCSIDYAGNIYGCQEVTSSKGADDIFCVGNIYDGVDEERRRALIQAFSATKIQGDECAECQLSRICDGGCVAHNYLYSGSILGVPPMYCWWQRLLLQEATYIMQTLGAEGNEAFKAFWEVTCGGVAHE